MSRVPAFDASYTYLVPEPRPKIVRQVCVDGDVIFDVDWLGRPVGVETLNLDLDWRDALVRLAMCGEVRLVHSLGQS